MTHSEKLLLLFARYCAATNRSESRISTIVLNGGRRIGTIRAGASFTVATYERALSWFSERWPPGTDWPEGVERPVALAEAAE